LIVDEKVEKWGTENAEGAEGAEGAESAEESPGGVGRKGFEEVATRKGASRSRPVVRWDDKEWGLS